MERVGGGGFVETLSNGDWAGLRGVGLLKGKESGLEEKLSGVFAKCIVADVLDNGSKTEKAGSIFQERQEEFSGEARAAWCSSSCDVFFNEFGKQFRVYYYLGGIGRDCGKLASGGGLWVKVV